MDERRPHRIALFMHALQGGGAERVVLDLAERFQAHGHDTTVVVGSAKGEYAEDLPEGLRIVEVGRAGRWSRWLALRADPLGLFAQARPLLLPRKVSGTVLCLPGLVDYLKRERPDSMLAVLSFGNLVAIWARELAGVQTRLVVSERNTLSLSRVATKKRRKQWRWRHLPQLMRRTYPFADVVTTVSDGVADDLAEQTGLPREDLVTVYNPVVTQRVLMRAKEPAEHPWFAEGETTPVLLGVGRLRPQKDFPSLMRAFAALRQKRPLRLLILGEGPEREKLQALADELGLGADFEMPGFALNPFAFMSRASVFVSSSRFEGLPNALIQALACGCKVVSTDCPSGPREILDEGRLGALVPVGDVDAIAEAVEIALDAPAPTEAMHEIAQRFSAEGAALKYLSLLLPDS